MKKLIKNSLIILSIISLSSCNDNIFTFKDITNHEVEEIESAMYTYGIFESAAFEFKGEYKKFIDTNYEYLGSGHNAITKYENAMNDAKFIICVNFDGYNSFSSVFTLTSVFYVSHNKIYVRNDNSGIYVSTNYLSLYNLKKEAEKE